MSMWRKSEFAERKGVRSGTRVEVCAELESAMLRRRETELEERNGGRNMPEDFDPPIRRNLGHDQ